MKIQDIKAPKGARKRKKIVGRGQGSGLGKTAGRGQNGQRSRSGGSKGPGYEGGQMPLIRRLPKRGFTSFDKKVFQIVKISSLDKFNENDVVSLEVLKEKNLIDNLRQKVKILGNGEIKKPLTVKANAFSKSAEEKVKAAGGKVEIL